MDFLLDATFFTVDWTVQQIPLVRAKYIHAFTTVLDRVGAPTERLLLRAGLSDRVREDVEAIVPAHQLWSFIELGARSQGIHDFGIQAGRVSLHDFGEFSSRLLRSPNLIQAAGTFCRLARHEYSRADFFVSQRGGDTWFCRGPIDGSDTEKKHVELLVVMMMIAAVRLAAGPNWIPDKLFLQAVDSTGIEDNKIQLSRYIRFGCSVTRFRIPHPLLCKQISPDATGAGLRRYERLTEDLPTAIRHVLSSWPRESEMRLSSVAEAVGMSRRTLQRRLDETGTSLSALIEDVRMNQAMRMLSRSTMSVGDIALELRYSDQANFTRAFRRWTGVSPQTYRHQRLTGEGDSAG